jgi:hypothetical protein
MLITPGIGPITSMQILLSVVILGLIAVTEYKRLSNVSWILWGFAIGNTLSIFYRPDL